MTGVSGRVVLDTSCVVALVSAWHERHDDVHAAVERYASAGAEIGLAAHTLIEAYAVLTRLPAPYRLSPGDAYALLAANFEETAKLQGLRSSEHWTFLRAAMNRGISGGRTYDALIARCAAKLTPCVLLTLNPRHFAGDDAEGMTVVAC